MEIQTNESLESLFFSFENFKSYVQQQMELNINGHDYDEIRETNNGESIDLMLNKYPLSKVTKKYKLKTESMNSKKPTRTISTIKESK